MNSDESDPPSRPKHVVANIHMAGDNMAAKNETAHETASMNSMSPSPTTLFLFHRYLPPSAAELTNDSIP